MNVVDPSTESFRRLSSALQKELGWKSFVADFAVTQNFDLCSTLVRRSIDLSIDSDLAQAAFENLFCVDQRKEL